MKNKKASEEDTSSLELDQEFELRTSAPQQEMERYKKQKKKKIIRKLKKINKKIKKNIYNPYINDDEKQTKNGR